MPAMENRQAHESLVVNLIQVGAPKMGHRAHACVHAGANTASLLVSSPGIHRSGFAADLVQELGAHHCRAFHAARSVCGASSSLKDMV